MPATATKNGHAAAEATLGLDTEESAPLAPALDIVQLRELTPETVFVPGGGQGILDAIRIAVADVPTDADTPANRATLRTMANRIASAKVAIDEIGKDYVAKIKALPNEIDAERKRMRDALDVLKADIRRPLTEYEDLDKKRVSNHRDCIQAIQDLTNGISALSTSDIEDRIARIAALHVDRDFQEFTEEAKRVREGVKDTLWKALSASRENDAIRAENERLRREAEEQKQREREAQVAREAEERARREAEAKAAEERARVERQAAEEKARLEHQAQAERIGADRKIREAEEARQKAETERQRAEQQAIEANQRAAQAEHAASVQVTAPAVGAVPAKPAPVSLTPEVKAACMAARDAMVRLGVPVEAAQNLVRAVLNRQVPHLRLEVER